VKVCSIHEKEIGLGLIDNSFDRNDKVENCLLWLISTTLQIVLGQLRTRSWEMASIETVSSVTSTANFLVVPPSRKECAMTNAPWGEAGVSLNPTTKREL
jgi:hypothetical protein